MVSARKLIVGHAKRQQVEQESFKKEVTVVNYCGQVSEKWADKLTVCRLADVLPTLPIDGIIAGSQSFSYHPSACSKA